MKITKVAFEKTIGMPNYSNDKPIVVECILEGNETKEEAWTKLNQDMIAWHQKEYPHLYPYSSPVASSAKGRVNESMPIISTEKFDPNDNLSLIQNAPSLEVLKTFKLIASVGGPLYDAYCHRIKELSNGPKNFTDGLE